MQHLEDLWGFNPLLEDFDADGLLDMAPSSGRVLLGAGDGAFASQQRFLGFGGETLSGDFNLDGRRDLAVLGTDFINRTGQLAILLNQGPFPIREVAVDIRPDSEPNYLNLRSAGVLPVAVLGAPDFDVSEIDPASVTLRRSDGNSPPAGADGPGGIEDANHDGLPDAIFHFRIEALGLAAGETTLTLEGTTAAGRRLRGQDSVISVGRWGREEGL